MANELDGARLKVVRAEEHLDALSREIGAYLDSNPWIFPVQDDGDETKTVKVEPPRITSQPPIRLSCIIGDCVTNLRASLDYVVWQLVQRHKPRALTEREEKSINFPVSKSPAAHSQSQTKLANLGVPTSALVIIESLQPYHAGNGPLGILDQLVNIDKHRLPLLTRADAVTGDVNVTVDKITAITNIITLPGGQSYKFAGLRAGASSISFGRDPKLKAAAQEPFVQKTGNVQVDAEITAFVSFDDPGMPVGPVQTTLSDILKTVADIIPRFESFF